VERSRGIEQRRQARVVVGVLVADPHPGQRRQHRSPSRPRFFVRGHVSDAARAALRAVGKVRLKLAEDTFAAV
jgi:hypothetical protein